MKKLLQTIAVLIVLVGAVFSAITYFASLDYVKASDADLRYEISMVSTRLKLQLNKEAIVQTNQMLWQYYNKYGNQDVNSWHNPTDKDVCRRLKLQLEELLRVREKLLKKGSK